MFNIKKIKAFIFDLDGTIIDTEPLYNFCWVKACSCFEYNLTYEKALKLRSLDSNLANLYLQSLFGKSFDYVTIREKRKEIMKDLINSAGVNQKQNILSVLNLLRKTRKQIAICSAASPETINNSLALAKVNFEFDKIISAKSVVRGKPYPEVYLYACKSLGISPEEALVIEDSPNGVTSAKKASCNVVMIPDLTQPNEKLKRNIDLLFKNLFEFEDYIKHLIQDN